MNKEEEITQERLKEVLTYNQETGLFTWNKPTRGNRNAGTIAGRKERGKECDKERGKERIGIDNKLYLAHRLAWLYVTGSFPADGISHINRNPYDNRWCNLRETTNSQRMKNKSKKKHGTSGYKGVCWDKKGPKGKEWRSQIMINGKQKFLGYYSDPYEGHKAYCEASVKNHGEFGCRS